VKANGWTHSFAIHSRGDWRERGEQIAHAIEFSNKNTGPGLRARISSTSSLQISFKRAAIWSSTSPPVSTRGHIE